MLMRSFLAALVCCVIASTAQSEDLDSPPTVAMVVVMDGPALLGLSVSVGMGDEFDRQTVGRFLEDGFTIGTRVTSTPDGSAPSCESDLESGFESSVLCAPTW